MKRATLPTDEAQEPQEEAYLQSQSEKAHPKKKNITFDKSYDEGSSSQNKYKNVLSQPAAELSHREKLLWLQKRRFVGLWAQCDDCDKWRYLPQVLDHHQLPRKWFCRMNPDTSFAKCSIPEEPLHVRDEEDLIHSEYSAGSIVWARLEGWPWWPAMVDDCPDTEQFYWLDGFSDIPTHYQVVFFDTCEVTRAWISPGNMTPYNAKNSPKTTQLRDGKKIRERISAAIAQADDAEKLSLGDRLIKYSFIARYNGKIGEPIKLNKQKLEQYNKKFLKKYNVSLQLDSDDEVDPVEVQKGTKNDEVSTDNLMFLRESADKGVIIEDQFMETDTLVPNSDITQIGSIKLETPNTFVDADTSNLSSSVLNPVGETQDSFKVRIPSSSNSDDFDF